MAPWRFVLASQEGDPVSLFLNGFNYVPQRDQDKVNLVITVNRQDSYDQRNDVTEALAHCPARARIVVTLGLREDRGLLDLCDKEGIGKPLRCQGGFELRYLLLQLNAQYVLESASPFADVEVVETDPHPLFGVRLANAPSRLLLTSAFSPTPEREAIRCIEAARDVDDVLHAAPGRPSFRIHQNATLSALGGLVGSVKESHERIIAWIHMGHGKEGDGLLQYDEDETAGTDAERWLACFEPYRGASLPLVFLGACYSAQVARHFAEAGAGLAIGFRGKVVARACQSLVRPVVHAALNSGGDPRRILQAFETGCRQLDSMQPASYLEAQPIAFCQRM